MLEEIRGIAEGGGFGSIIGRNSFQRPKSEAIELLQKVMDIYQGVDKLPVGKQLEPICAELARRLTLSALCRFRTHSPGVAKRITRSSQGVTHAPSHFGALFVSNT